MMILKHRMMWYGSSFLVPIGMIVVYFSMMRIVPFGTHGLLNYDLYHQYLDFFRYYRYALLNDHHVIWYSFSNGFGNEMISTWSYYLMSPFNVLTLIGSDQQLPFWVNLIWMLKLASSSTAMFWLLRHQFKQLTNVWMLILSLSYAFNGWIVTYYLNLLWLDAMIVLPILVWGLNQLIQRHRIRIYVIALTLMLIVNYYMAFMLIIFSGFWLLFALVQQHETFDDWTDRIFDWFKAILIASLLAAWILVPTVQALLVGKLNYQLVPFSFKLEYNPLKLLTMLMSGSFKNGDYALSLPHIFMGSVALVIALTFFVNSQLSRRLRWAGFLLTMFLVISLMWRPLDFFWHGFQMPNWFSYRWSFLFTFWVIYLAALSLEAGLKLTSRQWSIVGLLIGLGIIDVSYWMMHSSRFNAIKTGVSIVIVMMAFVLLWRQWHWAKPQLLIGFVIGDLFLNLFWTLNALPHRNINVYQKNLATVSQMANWIRPRTDQFYRSNKMFDRTFNDPLSLQYYSGDAFNSSLSMSNSQISNEFGQVYNLSGVKYENGTVVADSLLGFKDYLVASRLKMFDNFNDQRHLIGIDKTDLSLYNLVNATYDYQLFENPQALSLAYGASDQLRLANLQTDPIQYQNQLLQQLTGNHQHWFIPVQYQNQIQAKRQMIKVKIATNDPYYLVIQRPDHVYQKVLVNGQLHHRQESLAMTNGQIVPIADHQMNQASTIQIDLHYVEHGGNVKVYRLNSAAYQATFKQLQQHQLQITQFDNTEIRGTINIARSQSNLFTTIPYDSNWHVKIDGKAVSTINIQHFLTTKIKSGHHQVVFHYVNYAFNWGKWISIVTIVIVSVVFGAMKWRKRFTKVN